MVTELMTPLIPGAGPPPTTIASLRREFVLAMTGFAFCVDASLARMGRMNGLGGRMSTAVQNRNCGDEFKGGDPPLFSGGGIAEFPHHDRANPRMSSIPNPDRRPRAGSSQPPPALSLFCMELSRNLRVDSVSRLEPAAPLAIEDGEPVSAAVEVMR